MRRRILPRESGRDRRKLRACLTERHVFSETTKHLEPRGPQCRRGLALDREWKPHRAAYRKTEAWRHHANDGSRLSVNADDATHDVRIAGEARLPEVVSEQDNGRCVGTRVVSEQHAPAQRLHAEERKRRGRDEGTRAALGALIVATEVHVLFLERAQAAEAALRARPCDEVEAARVEIESAANRCARERDDLIGMLERK